MNIACSMRNLFQDIQYGVTEVSNRNKAVKHFRGRTRAAVRRDPRSSRENQEGRSKSKKASRSDVRQSQAQRCLNAAMVVCPRRWREDMGASANLAACQKLSYANGLVTLMSVAARVKRRRLLIPIDIVQLFARIF
jgi:hypothetical protein